VFVPRDNDQEAQHYLDEYARSNKSDDWKIPMETHVIPVRLSARERALYMNEANRYKALSIKPDIKKLVQLCSFFSPEGKDANADAAVVATRQENEAALRKHQAEMEKAAQDIKKLESEAKADFPSALDEAERKGLKDKLKRLIDSRPAAQKKEEQLRSHQKYFEEVLKDLHELDKEEAECPVCCDTLKRTDCMVTPCGHLFCQKCITACLHSQANCPTCRRKLQISSMQSATDILTSEQESELGRVTMFGSKVQAVCNQLNKIWQKEPGAKVIIFVQFEVLMRKMEGALKDLSLPCMTLQGTVFERRKIIRRFQSTGEDNRVLLLSLEKNPAGMNLVCCHHLLLVHPMYAQETYGQDMSDSMRRVAALTNERQAIGRVRRQGQRETVHVYRFWARDTIEEKLTREHHEDLLGDESVEKASASASSSATGSSSDGGSIVAGPTH